MRAASRLGQTLSDGQAIQLDTYLHRYLNFLGEGVGRALARTVKTDSPQALRDMIRRVEDTGADKLNLVPTTGDPAELERVAEALGW